MTSTGGWDLPFKARPKLLVKGSSLYSILSWRTGLPFTVTRGLTPQNSVHLSSSGEVDPAFPPDQNGTLFVETA